MKSARIQTSETSADLTVSTVTKFTGTDNPRHLRALHALLTRPMPREHLDRVAGCSNGPDLIASLRNKGLEIPCQGVSDRDRDGRAIKRGVYHLSDRDRRKVNRWLRERVVP